MGLGSYYRTVLVRAWRNMVNARQGLVVGLLIAIVIAFVTYWQGATRDGPFNSRLATVSAVVGTAVVALSSFVWNLFATAWRMHEEQC